MKRSLLLAAAALAAVTLVAAGCGGSDEVPADAVAVVDGTTITRASLDDLLARAKKSYTAQKRDFPLTGEAMDFASQWPGAITSPEVLKLGVCFRDTHETFRDAIRWLRANPPPEPDQAALHKPPGAVKDPL